MKGASISCALVAILFAHTNPSAAQEPAPAPVPAESAPSPGFDRFALGAYASLGMAHTFVKQNDDYSGEFEPRFAGGGGAYLDYRLSKMLALDTGVGLVGKGYRSPDLSGSYLRILYLEIPVGVKLDIHGLRICAALALEVGLRAVSRWKTNGGDWDDIVWGDERWKAYRRVNLGPRLALEYAIPVGRTALVPGHEIQAGRVAIVPGVTWSMDILDNIRENEPGAPYGSRNMNLMFNLGLEYGFGG